MLNENTKLTLHPIAQTQNWYFQLTVVVTLGRTIEERRECITGRLKKIFFFEKDEK